MANINRSAVIQLADYGIIDIVTEFDEEFVKDDGYCPTCGPMDYYEQIQWANVISTKGTQRIKFFKHTTGYPIEDTYGGEQLIVTEADLIQLLLNKDTLELLKEKTLEQFCDWLKDELEGVATHRWYERGNVL